MQCHSIAASTVRFFLSAAFALCVFLVKPCFSQGQKSAVDALLLDEKFRREVVEYSREKYRSPLGVPYLEIRYDSLRRPREVLLYAFAFLSQIRKNLPTGYAYLDERLILVYDETALPMPEDQWFSKLKELASTRLCDDVSERQKVGDVEVIPCVLGFDPPGWLLTFESGRLIWREQIF